jgi:hypothetical protein
MKSKNLKQPVPLQKSTLINPLQNKDIPQITTRPITAHTVRTVKPLMNRKKNDPVSRFQAMSVAWKKDAFLATGGSKK